ncbi:MAG TPA: cation diffusion facilitator family transporter [Solirubrobacteraceae bacterium]|jgi:cation diffusion facilitator family transporter
MPEAQQDAPGALDQQRTAIVSVAVAALLVALKLGVGLATASLGLISIGIESSGDVLAAALTFFVVRLGGRPADRGHPYGHRRAENLGALGEAAILIGGGLVVTVEALSHLISGAEAPAVHWYEFAVLGLALVLDISRVAVTLSVGRRVQSPALKANAVHFAGDAVGSLVVLAGLLASEAGFHQGDAVAALVVALIIFGAAGRLLVVNANVLMDRAPEEARARAMAAIAGLGPDVELTRLRLRESAGRYFADVVVRVPPGQAVVESHRTADMIESELERALPGSDVVVHVEPRRAGLDLRDRVLAIALSEPDVKEAHDITVFEHDDGRSSVSLHLKFPDELDLHAAHEIAERVEREISERDEVADVQTHLEPLERPLGPRESDERAEAAARAAVDTLIAARHGLALERLRLLSTEAGRVIFLTLTVGDGLTLTEAHELAGELEDDLRQRLGDVADVVVHTEP